MLDFLKKGVKEDHSTQKTFNYSKGKVALNFNLRIDIKNELKEFKELLETALEDVDQELTKFN